MLIDDILAFTDELISGEKIPYAPAELISDATFFNELLTGAAAYALDEQSSIFLESLSTDIITTSMAFKDVRLPHEAIFIEFAFPPVLETRQQKHRTTVGADDVVPHRLGVLLSRSEGRMCAWVFWDTNKTIVLPTIYLLPEHVQPLHAFEGRPRIRDKPGRPAATFAFEKMASFEPAMKFSTSRGDDAARLTSNWIRDVVDEIPICLALLLFLNHPDKETLDATPADLRKLNAARQKKNRPPMVSHTKIRLGELGRLHLRSIENTGGGSSGTKKAHFVRGHLMRSHGNMVWRRPHVRGVGVPTPVRSDISL